MASFVRSKVFWGAVASDMRVDERRRALVQTTMASSGRIGACVYLVALMLARSVLQLLMATELHKVTLG